MKLLLILLLAVIFIIPVSCQNMEKTDQDKTVLKKEIIKSPNAPKAIGPYSQAVKVGDMLFCSGQIAINPETGEYVKTDVKSEAKQVLENLKAVLNEAGMDFKDVVRATVFLKDINDYSAVNEVYASYFTEKPPARAAVQVGKLPKDVAVEISCIAVKTE